MSCSVNTDCGLFAWHLTCSNCFLDTQSFGGVSSSSSSLYEPGHLMTFITPTCGYDCPCISTFVLKALLSVCADVCSDGGTGASACGSSGSCPVVVTGGACLQGGEIDYPPPFAHRPISFMRCPCSMTDQSSSKDQTCWLIRAMTSACII